MSRKNIITHGCLRLFYSQYGSPNGKPVIYCHGYPGSLRECYFDNDVLLNFNICLVVIERPGYGHSQGTLDSDLKNWVELIEIFINENQWKCFSLIGFSGGGYYAQALAVSETLKNRIEKLALVSIAAPFNIDGIFKGMLPVYNDIYSLAQENTSQCVDTLQTLAADVDELWAILFNNLPTCDKNIITAKNMAVDIQENLQHAFLASTNGFIHDILAHTRKWPFSSTEIHCTTQVWHGELDINLPVGMALYMADIIPGCHSTISQTHGHYMLISYQSDILNFLSDPCD